MFDIRGLVHQALLALDQDRPADAEKSIRAALATNPRDDQLLHLLGVSLIRQQRAEEAIEPLQKAISLNRRDAEYHNALGCALRDAGRLHECLESFGRALRIEPRLHNAHYNLAQAYQRMGEFAKAGEKFAALVSSNPGDIDAIGGLANLRWFLGDFEGSLEILKRGLRHDGGDDGPRSLLADQLLALGRFEEGWFHYLWRMNRQVCQRKAGLPLENPGLMPAFGDVLEGMTVRVHAEQGIGDDLYFLRFARLLRYRGARVSGAVSPQLLEMIRRAGILDECDAAAARFPPDPGYRWLGDLPFLLQAFRLPLPAAVKIDPLPELVGGVLARLRDLPRPLIGLTWRAGTGPEAGNRHVLFKEVPLEDFAAMAQRLPGTLLVLQRRPRPGEVEKLSAACGGRVLDLSALNANLEEMHALLAQIDEYIGVSNTNMHLRAALGRSARVLVSRSVEFRWMAAGEQSPWFPGFPVYRQGAGGDWREALAAIAADLSLNTLITL